MPNIPKFGILHGRVCYGENSLGLNPPEYLKEYRTMRKEIQEALPFRYFCILKVAGLFLNEGSYCNTYQERVNRIVNSVCRELEHMLQQIEASPSKFSTPKDPMTKGAPINSHDA